jgi:hypothetical protein
MQIHLTKQIALMAHLSFSFSLFIWQGPSCHFLTSDACSFLALIP